MLLNYQLGGHGGYGLCPCANMSLILERSPEEGGAIYLGNLEAASNVEYLKAHGIGAVLTVAGGTGLRYSSRDIPLHDVIQADDALY